MKESQMNDLHGAIFLSAACLADGPVAWFLLALSVCSFITCIVQRKRGL